MREVVERGLTDTEKGLGSLDVTMAGQAGVVGHIRIGDNATIGAKAGVDPAIMGTGPIDSTTRALKIAGITLGEIGLIEANEAFAAQALGVIGQLDFDPEIYNVNGGAIALGHPLGCTGAKLSIQLINEMKRRNQKYGIVTACVGGGQGVAGVYERLN